MSEWRTIPGWPEYEASAAGEIRRVGSARALRPGNYKGYRYVELWRDGRPTKGWVHRLVCAAFHGPAPSAEHEAAHGNGVPGDNVPRNLRWATKTENEADKVVHGTSNAGERNGMAKLTNEQVTEILRRVATLPLSAGGCRFKKGALSPVAAEFGVTRNYIRILHSRQKRSLSQ